MFKFNRIPKIGLVLFVIAFAYLASLTLLGQERALDWRLSNEEMYLHEKLLALAVAGGSIATWFLGMYRAHVQGSWRWFVACFFVWPIAFVYTLAVNTGRED